MHALRRNRTVLAILAGACFIAGIGLAFGLERAGHPLPPVLAVYSPHVYPPSALYVDEYQKGITVASKAAILMDVSTATVLFGKNEHQRRDPASTTKVMTAILALELGRPDDIVTVSSRAAWTQGSSLNLRPGDRLSLLELTKGVLMCSGNDGSVAIAEHIAGSVNRFAEMMTARAKQLGAPNSSFRNPHGLTAVNHYSTAYDLAMMTRHALAYPEFCSAVSAVTDTMTFEDGRVQQLHNTNRMLWSYPGADGVKTGTTSAAGQCLIASATRDSWQLIAVVMAGSSRWSDAQRLLEYRLLVVCEKTTGLQRISCSRSPCSRRTQQQGQRGSRDRPSGHSPQRARGVYRTPHRSARSLDSSCESRVKARRAGRRDRRDRDRIGEPHSGRDRATQRAGRNAAG